MHKCMEADKEEAELMHLKKETKRIYELYNVGLVNAAMLKLIAAGKEEAERTHLCGSNKIDLSVMQH